MKRVEPSVYLMASTGMNPSEMNRYLDNIGSPEWEPSREVSAGENLVEAAGRMCYRSWQPYDPEKPECSNPNVTKVREGNKEYLGHILKVGHGSILEHVSMTFICRNVSRVMTHEIVRHRAGCAYSQESLRYVRLTDLSFWMPPDADLSEEGKEAMVEAVRYLEKAQAKLTEAYGIDEGKKNFHKKKQLTSMFRRVAPIGLATSIMFTANIRALRHMIAMRTSEGAEIEIRVVFNMIARICKREYPNFFQDMEEIAGASGEPSVWEFEFEKV